MNRKSSNAGTTTLIFIWPLIASLLMLVTASLSHPWMSSLEYTQSLDEAFLVAGLLITLGHLFSFVSIPILLRLYSPEGISQFQLRIAAVTGGLTFMMQVVLRVLADQTSRLDCGDSCVSEVMPAFQGTIVNISVTAVLLIAYIASYQSLKRTSYHF